MDFSSLGDKNPWADDERTFGSIRNVLLLAERTGHLPKDRPARAVHGDYLHQTVPSLQMIDSLKKIDERKREIARVNLEIQKRLWDRETQDLMHLDVLEKRIKEINELSGHIQKIVSHKDHVIGVLQKPHVGDFVRIEASYKSYVSEIFPKIVPILGEMSSQLNNIEWAMHIDFSDGQLDKLLSDVNSCLATLQSSILSLIKMRDTLRKLGEDSTEELS